jgi:hypothetical protein
MNKKNTKKFIKRMIDNYITILPCKFTDISQVLEVKHFNCCKCGSEFDDIKEIADWEED